MATKYNITFVDKHDEVKKLLSAYQKRHSEPRERLYESISAKIYRSAQSVSKIILARG